jgi:hypothetical protein
MVSTVIRLPLRIVALLLWLTLALPVAGQDAADVALRGAFAVTIAPEDVPPELIDGASLIGRWRVTFSGDGTYLLERQDVGPLATGQFAADGDLLTLRGETGVLACPPREDDEEAATYHWEMTEERLLLIAVEEPCAKRRLLLTTRTLFLFAACPPRGIESPATTVGTPIGDSTPSAPALPEPAVDTLLRQMSDCWATRDPDRFLALLSQDFRAAQQPDDYDDVVRFTLRMGAPLVWERVSAVERIDATHASASVRQLSGDNIDILRYDFVYQDGAWRWDGTSGGP